MPKVSVVIPAYNHEKYIFYCIQSVLNQTFQDFEIILTDDGSQDKTVKNIQQFNDPRIKLLTHDKNKGASIAINNCIKNSSGDFIACLGSDDAWVPEKLEKQVRFLEENLNVSAVFTREIIINENNNRVNHNNIYSNAFDQALQNHSQEEWTRFFFFNGNCLCAPSSMIRRKIFDEVGLFNERLAGLQDFDMWVKICLRHDIHVIDDRLTLYRTRENYSNLSADTPEKNTRNRVEFKQILNNFLQIKDVGFFKKAFPGSRKYGKLEPMLIPYFLGRIALDINRDFQRQWGIETIYNLLGNGELANLLEKDCGFSYVDFSDLTKKTMGEDIYLRPQLAETQAQLAEKEQTVQALTSQVAEKEQQLVEKEQQVQVLTTQLAKKEQQLVEKEQQVQVLTTQLAKKEQTVQALTAQVVEREQKLAEIKSSKAWKIALLFCRIRVLLAPPNSHRARVLRRLINIIFVPFKKIGRNRRLKEDLALIRSSDLFDETWYLANNPDVTQAKIDPMRHYLLFGGFEGRDPGPNFCSAWYLDAYEDVKKAGINPLIHYLKHGREEGRTAQDQDLALIST